MLLLNGAANRDERHWTDPDRFDVHRDEGPHLVVRLRAPLLPRRRAGAARGAGRAGGDPAPLAGVGRRHRPRADGPHRQRARVGLPPRPTRARGATMGKGNVRRRRSASSSGRPGGIGSLSIVAVNERPDLELVGVWVHSEEKVGKDAGELANGVPIGVTATNDVDALLALEAGLRDLRRAAARSATPAPSPDYERILAAGRQRRHDDLDHAHQPARLRARAPRATGGGRPRGRGVDLRVGHRARVPVRPPADRPLDGVAVGQQGPLLRDRALRRLRRQGDHDRRPRLRSAARLRAVDHAARRASPASSRARSATSPTASASRSTRSARPTTGG